VGTGLGAGGRRSSVRKLGDQTFGHQASQSRAAADFKRIFGAAGQCLPVPLQRQHGCDGTSPALPQALEGFSQDRARLWGDGLDRHPGLPCKEGATPVAGLASRTGRQQPERGWSFQLEPVGGAAFRKSQPGPRDGPAGTQLVLDPGQDPGARGIQEDGPAAKRLG